MANMLIGFPNRADAATGSGGSYTSGLPASNAQDPMVSKKARTTDATAASTKRDWDFGAAYPIRILALVGHNLTLSATVRWYLDDNPSFSSPYDSTALSAYPTFYPSGTTLWGASVGGTALSQEEYDAGARFPVIHVPSSVQTYRYLRMEIVDTSNPDGYVDFGRVFACQAWQPTINAAYGLQMGYNTATTKGRSDGAAQFVDERERYRIARGVLPQMSEDETMVQATEFLRRCGTHEQMFFVFDPDDTEHMQRRAFPCTADKLAPFAIQAGMRSGVPFTLTEVI